jgi:hypothetical protein
VREPTLHDTDDYGSVPGAFFNWKPMTCNLTREQLYDLVWSEPLQRLAKRISISDVAIANHCRTLGVPERGC